MTKPSQKFCEGLEWCHRDNLSSHILIREYSHMKLNSLIFTILVRKGVSTHFGVIAVKEVYRLTPKTFVIT